MSITLNGTTGITTPAIDNQGNLTVDGSFRQTGATVPFEWTVNAGAADFLKLNAVGYADNLLVANSSGNVGIGTTSPSFVYGGGLEIQSGGSDATLRVDCVNAAGEFSARTGEVLIGATGGTPLKFITDNTERMRIDSTGRATMPYQPAFRATSDNTSQTLTNLVPAVAIFKATETNRGSVYNTANGRFTAPLSGFYTLSASLLIGQGGASRFDMHFRKNGGAWLDHEFRDGGAVSTNASFNISAQGQLAANDFIEVVVTLHGANGSIYQEPKFWSFSGALLS